MKAQIKARATLDVEIEPRDLSSAIGQYIVHVYGAQDDAGCDWYTDDRGQVYFAGNPQWKPYPADKNLAALVDAMNILAIGYALRMPEYQTWEGLLASGELSGYEVTVGNDIDAGVVARNPCERCGKACEYIAMVNHSGDSYRGFARCRACDAVFEF